MIASSFTDPIIGIDIHWELIPMPAPTPTPVPNPFTGMVFDPVGLAVGIALGAAMSAVLGTPFQGPVIYWGAFPATNTGTEGMHVPGHILIPPGTGWAPVPKTPKPVIRPGETPDPPKPISPDNDAIAIFGSKTVSVMGSNAVRLGDIFLSCSEPVRLPSSVVVAIPKGAPILIGGPPSLDIMAAVMASLRTRFMSDSLHSLVSRLSPGRFRNLLHRGVCFLTGHPVDVASGKVLTEYVDAALPGALPIQVDRIYSSAWAKRDGPVGHGWSSSLDQAVWRERGKVVLRSEDGREIEFDSFDLPGHRVEVGQTIYNPMARLTLRCLSAEGGAGEVWEVTAPNGVVRRFRPVAGETERGGALGPIARIESMRDRTGSHRVGFFYDQRGCLEWVRDSSGRTMQIEHDANRRMSALRLPKVHGEGWTTHRIYRYDSEGDLVAVEDALGNCWRFEYVTHLLTREVDRNGHSYYFAYDGYGADGWCTRTWGDGGIFDRELIYDKQQHRTWVTDSLGNTTEYQMNVAGMVTKMTDPLGGATEYVYDPETLRRTQTIAPGGHTTTFAYDERGNLNFAEHPDGATLRLTHDHNNNLVRAQDAIEGVWTWRYDTLGQLVEATDALGRTTTHGWDKGLPAWIRSPGGRWIEFIHDHRGQLIGTRNAAGAETRQEWDARGRRTRINQVGGIKVSLHYDVEGRLVELSRPSGERQRRSYDAEGNLLTIEDPCRRVRLGYGVGYRISEREEDGRIDRLEYDTEGRLGARIDAAGNRRTFARDPAGRVVLERLPDGGERHFAYDQRGQLVALKTPAQRKLTMKYDARGRVTDIERSDGGFTRFGYRADGAVIEAINEAAAITFERDALGRVLRETSGDSWVQSRYDLDGGRVGVETSRGLGQWHDLGPGGEVAQIVLEDRAEIGIERDPLGHEVTRWLPGDVAVRWHRDELGRAAQRSTLRTQPSSQTDSYAREDTGILEDRRWCWRGSDQLVAIEDALRERITRYEYDGLGRVVREQRREKVIERAHDDQGNVYRRADRGDREYADDGQLRRTSTAQYRYDADGHRTERIDGDGATWSFGYDDNGLLRAIEKPDGQRIDYEYDALGRRIRKSRTLADGVGIDEDVRYVWDGRRILHELRPEQETISWYWSPYDPAPIAKRRGQQLWSIVADHMGNPTEMYDERGQLSWQAQLDIYGRAELSTGEASDCPWRWPGQYEDADAELYCNGFRYYDPFTGTYTSRDPLGLVGNPNPYAYPANVWAWTDPLGLAPQTFDEFWASAQAWNAGEGAATPMSDNFMYRTHALYEQTLRSTEIPVIGDFGDVAHYIDQAGPGHAKLSLPMPPSTGFHWNTFVNDQWMQAFIDKRATIMLATEPVGEALESADFSQSVFAREMDQLNRAGYNMLGKLGDPNDPLRMEPPCR